MKVKIVKYEPFRKGSWLYKLYYRIIYKEENLVGEKLDILVEDMDKFVKEVNKEWNKIKKENK